MVCFASSLCLYVWISIFPSPSLSYTSPRLFSHHNTVQWQSLQTTESEQCAYSLSKRSYHCMAHSYSWGHGQTGALIGPVKAQNPPLWSELTAIGWLFIGNHIPVDPVANGYRFFLWLHVRCDSGPKTESSLKRGALDLNCKVLQQYYQWDHFVQYTWGVPCFWSSLFSESVFILTHTVCFFIK